MKKQFKRYIALLLVVFGALTPKLIGAQEIRAIASLDSMVIPIGQQQKLRLELTQPKNAHINFPVFSDTIMDKIEIVQKMIPDTLDNGNTISVFQDYTITSFDSGVYYFEPFVFGIDESLGGGEIKSNPLVMKVITFQIDTAQAIFDIKEPMELKYEFREILPWIIGGVLLVVIIGAIFWLFRQLNRKEPVIPFMKPKPVDPPHVIALRELEALKAEKLWQTDRLKLFYTKLTDVLRIYIEGRYHVLAMEKTTAEILKDLRPLLTEEKAALRNMEQILGIADLVKFAKLKPLPNENDLCMMNAILFVEQTRPVEIKTIDEVKQEMENGK